MQDWQLREQQEIKQDEGLELVVYLDSLGNPTAGYGHMDHTLKVGTAITQQEADDWFAQDFETALTAAKQAVPFIATLDGPRQGVFVNMAFNMGAKTLASFHGTLAATDSGDYDQAATNLLNSKYARQVGLRAWRLAYRLRYGEYADRA